MTSGCRCGSLADGYFARCECATPGEPPLEVEVRGPEQRIVVRGLAEPPATALDLAPVASGPRVGFRGELALEPKGCVAVVAPRGVDPTGSYEVAGPVVFQRQPSAGPAFRWQSAAVAGSALGWDVCHPRPVLPFAVSRARVDLGRFAGLTNAAALSAHLAATPVGWLGFVAPDALCGVVTLTIDSGIGVRRLGLSTRFADYCRGALGFVRDLLGADPPLPTIEVVVAATASARAVSVPGMVVLDPSLMRTRGLVEWRYIAHEVAHQWFGDWTSGMVIGDECFDREVVAEYVQSLYIIDRLGKTALPMIERWLGEIEKHQPASHWSAAVLRLLQDDNVGALRAAARTSLHSFTMQWMEKGRR